MFETDQIQVLDSDSSSRYTATRDKLQVTLAIPWWHTTFFLGMASSRMTPPPSAGHEGSLNSLNVYDWMKEMRWNGLHRYQISIQLITSGRLWSDMSHSGLHQHHQNTNWENIFLKNGARHSSTIPETWIRHPAVQSENIKICFFIGIHA